LIAPAKKAATMMIAVLMVGSWRLTVGSGFSANRQLSTAN